MRSPRTPTFRMALRPVSGSTTCPPWITTSKRSSALAFSAPSKNPIANTTLRIGPSPLDGFICALVRELQFTLNRLEARLVAQWVEQWVGLEALQAWISPAYGCFEPLQGLRGISPLRVDHGVYSRTAVAPKRLQLAEGGFRIGMLSELLVGDRQTLLAKVVLSSHCLARAAGSLQVSAQI